MVHEKVWKFCGSGFSQKEMAAEFLLLFSGKQMPIILVFIFTVISIYFDLSRNF